MDKDEKNNNEEMDCDDSNEREYCKVPAAIIHEELHAFSQWMESFGVHQYLKDLENGAGPMTSDEEIENLSRSQAGYFEKKDFWADSQKSKINK